VQAIVLAGGKGTRLRPYTTVFPKPLVPVGDHPIAEIIVRQLRAFGYTRITFAVSHLAELVEAFFADGTRWGVSISYSREEKPLGTAGPIRLVQSLDENFLVMNGDVLTNMDFRELMRGHLEHRPIATITSYRKQVLISLGVLEMSPDKRLTGYVEKPTLDYRASMGIYTFNRRVLDFIPPDQYLDLPDLMKILIQKGERVRCFEFEGDWLDIGRPEDYAQALEDYEKNTARFLPDATP